MDNYNTFPATYQPMYQQPNMYYQPTQTAPVYQQRWQQPSTTAVPNYQQQAQPTNFNQVSASNVIWVQGISGAKSYSNLQPGVPVALWDSEEQTIYVKQIDQSGKPQMTILDYTERVDAPVKNNDASPVEYATKEQVEELNTQLSSFNEKINAMGKYVTKDQLESLNGHIKDLSGQIEDIEDRIMSFGKPQQNNNQNNRRGNK